MIMLVLKILAFLFLFVIVIVLLAIICQCVRVLVILFAYIAAGVALIVAPFFLIKTMYMILISDHPLWWLASISFLGGFVIWGVCIIILYHDWKHRKDPSSSFYNLF
jgi:hypothetical protein